MFSTGRWIVFAALLLAGVSASAAAGPLYDFSTGARGGKTTGTGADQKPGPITASSFQRSGASGAWTSNPIALAGQGDVDDRGLRVCSGPACESDPRYNELSPLYEQEAILLSLDTGWNWTELWVSSLEGDGTGGTTSGRIYWGDTADIPTLLLGGATRSFSFKFSDLTDGKAQGDLLSIDALKSIFDTKARHVLFVPDGKLSNTAQAASEAVSYRVSGGGAKSSGGGKSTIPEPATVLLVGVGLAGAGLRHLRRARRRP